MRDEVNQPRTIGWAFVCSATISVVGPIVACFFVIDELVGTARLTRPYWLWDGIAISAAMNTLFGLGLIHPEVRRVADKYAMCVACFVSLLTYIIYRALMIALIGV